MKVLVFVKATANSEQGIFPPDAARLFEEMGKYNEQLVKAGIMKEGDGLKPSRAGKRIKFTDDGQTTVIDGPFAETKELVAGYWVWNVKSMDEAVEWARKCPNPMPGEEGVLELRPTYEIEDFGDKIPKEEIAREERLRKMIKRPAQRKGKAKARAKPASHAARRKPARAKSKK